MPSKNKKRTHNYLQVRILLVIPGRFELPTLRLGGECSIQLSYGTKISCSIKTILPCGNYSSAIAPGGMLHSTLTSVLTQSLPRQTLKFSKLSSGIKVFVTN